ncbi:MAG: hypothetical protein SFV22_03340 [Saprospiraceae bacterium]|nr:hypothetical protein [Saprospiraceae bacterium]
MFFTSQRSTTGQQAQVARSLRSPLFTRNSAINWSRIWICSGTAGNRCEQYAQPGLFGKSSPAGSKPVDGASAQIQVNMKNARKVNGVPAGDKLQSNTAPFPNNPADTPIFDPQIFAEKPAPRQPESPEVESLRSLLKANMTREKASPALMERIRNKMQDPKS